MSAWCQRQRLEHAVEVVHDAGVEAVDVDGGIFCRFGFHAQAYLSVPVIDGDVPVRVSPTSPPGIRSEKRIVKVAADEDVPTHRDRGLPVRRMTGNGASLSADGRWNHHHEDKPSKNRHCKTREAIHRQFFRRGRCSSAHVDGPSKMRALSPVRDGASVAARCGTALEIFRGVWERLRRLPQVAGALDGRTRAPRRDHGDRNGSRSDGDAERHGPELVGEGIPVWFGDFPNRVSCATPVFAVLPLASIRRRGRC